MPHDNFFKIYLKFACVLRRLFLSVVSLTRVVYFYVNVTCFAAKHLKFDNHHSNYRQEPILIGSCCCRVFDQRVPLIITRDDVVSQRLRVRSIGKSGFRF